MSKYYIIILFSLAVFSPVKAQVESQSEEIPLQSKDSFTDEIGGIPESLEANIDSLLQTWHVQYFSKTEDFCHDEDENVYFNDDVINDRLKRLPHIIPMNYNTLVRKSIDFYTNRKRNLIRYMLGMADFYFPIIEPILEEHGLPLELKYLAVVESALNPVAVSRVGAGGIWQFMLPTGKSYGLEINSLVDERRDPAKATHAACLYFKDMYNIFNGDWNLIIASYNCGPGNVSKAIRRAGGDTNFWNIYQYLPKETRSYVPLFIAACYVMNYYCDHNICPMRTTLPLATDTVMVNQNLSLQKIADLTNMDIGMLRVLNPQYRRDIIPGNSTVSAILKLPASQTSAFIDKENDIYSSANTELSSASGKQQQITHTVQRGENLVTIADKYGVTAKDIRKWNGLGSNTVAAGKRLTLKVNNGGIAYAATKTAPVSTPSTTPASKEQANTPVQNTTQTQVADKTKAPVSAGSNFTTYTVKSGDSLYSISRNAGITVEILKKANNMTGTSIHPGQKLKIPVG